MRWIGEALWLIAAAITYAVYGPLLGINDAVPILTVIVIVRVALTSGPLAGNITGFAGGLLLDVSTPEWFGAAMLVDSIIGFVVGMMRERIVLDSPLARFVVLLVAAVTHSLGIVVMRSFVTPDMAPEPFINALGSGSYTAILGGVWWTLCGVIRAVIGWRSIWYVERQ
ncbi:MAG: rod shape-determining protein MreD [Sphaerochaeta sp.]|jgi:rod shape-determining protein MreD|nr:rod shape-determining protein MreD [Sphaerochaeta sp.]